MPVDEFLHLVRILQHFRVSELVVHILIFLQQVHDRLHTFAHDVDHRLAFIQQWLLLQVTDAVSGCHMHVALKVLLLACDDPHQCGLTGSVEAEDADLGTVVKAEVDVLEDGLSGGQRLADLHHVVDDLTSFFCHVR